MGQARLAGSTDILNPNVTDEGSASVAWQSPLVSVHYDIAVQTKNGGIIF